MSKIVDNLPAKNRARKEKIQKKQAVIDKNNQEVRAKQLQEKAAAPAIERAERKAAKIRGAALRLKETKKAPETKKATAKK